MNQNEIVLAALSASNGALHSPVQVQKLLFLIDRNLGKDIGGPHFNFHPYNYGPFDRAVYETLESLGNEGFVEIVSNHSWKEYALTEKGRAQGMAIFESLPIPTKKYIAEVSRFVRSLSFTQLVSAIYKAYPEMRANSVFQE